MQKAEKISSYLKTVCEQIRWKKAHRAISEEIENHITDQTNAFTADGLDEEAATDRAIEEMGDPIVVGMELDRAYKPKVEWSIIALTICILLIGIAVQTFITYDTGKALALDRLIIIPLVGIVCMVISYFLDFTILGKYPRIIYSGYIVIMLVAMKFSPHYNGQSYYTKFTLLLLPTVFAAIIYAMRNRGYLGILLCGAFFAVPAAIGVAIPSISCVWSATIICLFLLTFAIVKDWFNVKRSSAIMLVYIPILVFIALIISRAPYLFRRLLYVINPFLSPMDEGWLATIIRDTITNARLLGPGQSEANMGYSLPEINSNLVLTYLIGRLGWISFIAIMVVLLALIIRSFTVCCRQKSVLGRLVSMSVWTTFTIEVFSYVIFNLGFTMSSPMSLPLISYGSTATIINMALIGLMLSVFKSDKLAREGTRTAAHAKNKLFEIADGKIIIYFNAK